MTIFNEEKFIQRSLKSVINQSFKNWEAVIIDDCSTDNSARKKRLGIEELNTLN